MRFGYRRQHCLQTFFVIQRVKQLKNLLLPEPMRFWLTVIDRWHHRDGNWIGVRYSLFSTSSFLCEFFIGIIVLSSFTTDDKTKISKPLTSVQTSSLLSSTNCFLGSHQWKVSRRGLAQWNKRQWHRSANLHCTPWFQRICFNPEIELFTDTAAILN